MFRRQPCSPGPMEVSIGWRAGLCFYRCCWGGGEAAWLRESLLKVRKFISRGSGGSEKAPLVPGHPGCFSREWILSCSRSAVSFHMPPCPYRNQKGAGSADRKSTRLNSSHVAISYAVFCLKKKTEDSTYIPPY